MFLLFPPKKQIEQLPDEFNECKNLSIIKKKLNVFLVNVGRGCLFYCFIELQIFLQCFLQNGKKKHLK